jgi:hypothetical protein
MTLRSILTPCIGCAALPRVFVLWVLWSPPCLAQSIAVDIPRLWEWSPRSGSVAEGRAYITIGRFLPDGRVVLADSRRRVITILRTDGSLLSQWTPLLRSGLSLLSVSALWVNSAGDIGVYDAQATYLVWYGSDGTVLRESTIRHAEAVKGALALFVGEFSTGEFAAGWVIGSSLSYSEAIPDRLVFGLFSPGGGLRRILGESRGLRRQAGSVVINSPFPQTGVFRDTIFFTDGSDGVITVWSIADPSSRFFRVPESSNRRSTDDPITSMMFIDDQGWLWVKRHEPTTDRVPPDLRRRPAGGEWLVLPKSVETWVPVALPAGLHPLDLRNDRLLAVITSPTADDKVALFAVKRSPSR